MNQHQRKACRQMLGLACSGGMSEVEKYILSHLFVSPMAWAAALFSGPQTGIVSPPPYLGDSQQWLAARIHLWEALTPRCQTCWVQLRPGPVLDTLTLDLFPVSHLKVSEMDEDLSEALFWVCECSTDHLRFDILEVPSTFSFWKISPTIGADDMT